MLPSFSFPPFASLISPSSIILSLVRICLYAMWTCSGCQSPLGDFTNIAAFYLFWTLDLKFLSRIVFGEILKIAANFPIFLSENYKVTQKTSFSW